MQETQGWNRTVVSVVVVVVRLVTDLPVGERLVRLMTTRAGRRFRPVTKRRNCDRSRVENLQGGVKGGV